jgi:hypothetical protein
MNSAGGARKTKVSTGTLGSPFNQQNNPSGIPASAHATAIANAANHAKAPSHKEGRDKDRKEKAIREAVAAQQKQRDHQQHQRKTSKQSQQYTFPQSSTANSSNTALPNNEKSGIKAAPGSARKAPPPVSGTNNPLNMSITASGNGSVAANGLRRRTSSSASDRSIKKDDLLDRLAQALKWVVFISIWVLCTEKVSDDRFASSIEPKESLLASIRRSCGRPKESLMP